MLVSVIRRAVALLSRPLSSRALALRPSALSRLLVVGFAMIGGLTLLAQPVRVIDGDSVQLLGIANARLAGLDTPEIRGSHCLAEKQLGRKAAERLAELLSEGTPSLTWMGTRLDKFARPLVRIAVGGRDVAETLIAEGYGRAYEKGARKGWCAEAGKLARMTGLEPATSGVTGRRSNQLSYIPGSPAEAAGTVR